VQTILDKRDKGTTVSYIRPCLALRRRITQRRQAKQRCQGFRYKTETTQCDIVGYTSSNICPATDAHRHSSLRSCSVTKTQLWNLLQNRNNNWSRGHKYKMARKKLWV